MPRTKQSGSTERSPRTGSLDADEIAIVGITSLEARELCAAATAAGLRIRPLGFKSPEVEAAMAAFGPGTVRLPLVIVGGRYALQRPDFAGVLKCLELLRGADQALPADCAMLAGAQLPRTPNVRSDRRLPRDAFALTAQSHRSDEKQPKRSSLGTTASRIPPLPECSCCGSTRAPNPAWPSKG